MARNRFKDILTTVFSGPEEVNKRIKEENEKKVERDERFRRSRPRGLPVYLNVETVRQCNLTCRMCPFHANSEAKKKWGVADGKMDVIMFRQIARELFPTLKTCALSVTGEFTLTEYLQEVFTLLGNHGVKFDGFTNGVLLTSEISKMIMPHLECLTLSIDSPVAKTYEHLRHGAIWGVVTKNIEDLMAIRESSRNKIKPRLDLQAVLMRSTIETLPGLVRLAKQMGFDLVKGVHLGVFSKDMIEESLLKHRELYNKKREEAVNEAEEAGIEILLPPPLKEKTRSLEQRGDPPEGCEFLWRRSFINFDGAVYACCAPQPPLMGNFTGAPFAQIWKGAAYKELRRRIFTDDPHPACKKCWIRSGDIPEGMEEELLFHID